MASSVDIPVVLTDDYFIPHYATELAAGADLRACLQHPVSIAPGESALIPTGVRCQIPAGFELQIRPRSGLALKHGITVLNTPGTIDADYRGEIGVILINHSKAEYVVGPGTSIAQAVLTEVRHAVFVPTQQLTATARGSGGFGHTG